MPRGQPKCNKAPPVLNRRLVAADLRRPPNLKGPVAPVVIATRPLLIPLAAPLKVKIKALGLKDNLNNHLFLQRINNK